MLNLSPFVSLGYKCKYQYGLLNDEHLPQTFKPTRVPILPCHITHSHLSRECGTNVVAQWIKPPFVIPTSHMGPSSGPGCCSNPNLPMAWEKQWEMIQVSCHLYGGLKRAPGSWLQPSPVPAIAGNLESELEAGRFVSLPFCNWLSNKSLKENESIHLSYCCF